MAAALANRLEFPTTKLSKVYRGERLVTKGFFRTGGAGLFRAEGGGDGCSAAGSCSANRSSSTSFFLAMTNLLSPVRDIFHYTIFPGMWISAGSKRGEPAENLAPGSFPQEREFSTESYPQVWTTLGKTPEIQAGRGICERAFCGQRDAGKPQPCISFRNFL